MSCQHRGMIWNVNIYFCSLRKILHVKGKTCYDRVVMALHWNCYHSNIFLPGYGQLLTFGCNRYGQLGVGDFKKRYAVTLVRGLLTGRQVTQVSCGDSFTVIATSGGYINTGCAEIFGSSLSTAETPYSTIPYTTIFYITGWTHGPQNLQRPIRTLIMLLGFWIKEIFV